MDIARIIVFYTFIFMAPVKVGPVKLPLNMKIQTEIIYMVSRTNLASTKFS